MQRVEFDGANAKLERAKAFLMQEPDCIPRTAVCEGFVEECTPRLKVRYLDAGGIGFQCTSGCPRGHVWAARDGQSSKSEN